MIAKITAVEWLIDELKESIGLKDMHAIEKAKQMEKQQIKEAYLRGIKNYNPTFKTK